MIADKPCLALRKTGNTQFPEGGGEKTSARECEFYENIHSFVPLACFPFAINQSRRLACSTHHHNP